MFLLVGYKNSISPLHIAAFVPEKLFMIQCLYDKKNRPFITKGGFYGMVALYGVGGVTASGPPLLVL